MEGRDRVAGHAGGGLRPGDPAALQQLHTVLVATPQLWTAVGNLGPQAERTLIRTTSGDNPVVKDAIVRKLDALRWEVAGPKPSVLESLFAGRVAST